MAGGLDKPLQSQGASKLFWEMWMITWGPSLLIGASRIISEINVLSFSALLPTWLNVSLKPTTYVSQKHGALCQALLMTNAIYWLNMKVLMEGNWNVLQCRPVKCMEVSALTDLLFVVTFSHGHIQNCHRGFEHWHPVNINIEWIWWSSLIGHWLEALRCYYSKGWIKRNSIYGKSEKNTGESIISAKMTVLWIFKESLCFFLWNGCFQKVQPIIHF